MAASVHNFILTFNELNIIQGLLRDSYDNAPDDNCRNSTKVLMDKLVEQLYSGYPAKDYPFWRKYFDKFASCTTCQGNINHCHCGE
jgi:hypothetical protein